MNTHKVCATVVATLGAVLALASTNAMAGKPGGGGSGGSTSCTAATSSSFPAFSYTLRRYSKSAGYENELWLADDSGACTILVGVVPGDIMPRAHLG